VEGQTARRVRPSGSAHQSVRKHICSGETDSRLSEGPKPKQLHSPHFGSYPLLLVHFLGNQSPLRINSSPEMLILSVVPSLLILAVLCSPIRI
jgi:hypothetical protein